MKEKGKKTLNPLVVSNIYFCGNGFAVTAGNQEFLAVGDWIDSYQELFNVNFMI